VERGRPLDAVGTDLTQYDLLLFVLPLPLVLGGLVTAASGVALPLGLGAGAVPSILLLWYGLFVAAPAPAPGE
jgi:hypothetical protein